MQSLYILAVRGAYAARAPDRYTLPLVALRVQYLPCCDS